MFTIGIAELAIILVIGLILLAVPIGIIVLVLLVTRRGSNRVASLEAENRDLREQLNAARDKSH